MKQLIISFLLFLASFGVFASPLEDFKKGYEDGTFLAETSDYADLYSRSSERKMEISNVFEADDRIDAYYSTSMMFEGQPYEQKGVMSLYIEDGKVVREEHAPITNERYLDIAMAGQAADVATTAAALSMGFVEGNPLSSAAIASPVGAVAWVGLKVGGTQYVKSKGLNTCREWRTALGTTGWFAAAWNVGMVAAGPAAAVVLAVAAGGYALDSIWKDSPTQCIERRE